MEYLSWSKVMRANYSSLSPGQKKVAEFYINHPDEAALLTAFQLGKMVGVSETTVIRLAYALGFNGYSQLQEIVRQDWLANKQKNANEGIPSPEKETDETTLFNKVINQEIHALKQLSEQVKADNVWKAVDALISADKVYIGGLGSSFAASYWFFYSLKQLRENVLTSSPSGFLVEDVCDLTEKSAAVIFSFPRYRQEIVTLTKFVKKQGSHIIAITDSQLSPIGQMAELTLTTVEHTDSGYRSIASVISLLEVIIAGIKLRNRELIAKRQQKLEVLYTSQELFLE